MYMYNIHTHLEGVDLEDHAHGVGEGHALVRHQRQHLFSTILCVYIGQNRESG
jgi:hypothetical protein